MQMPVMVRDGRALKKVLDGLYDRYNHRQYIGHDPLQFVYRYSEPCDIEVAAFLSAGLAYGRVEQIERSLEVLLRLLGQRPGDFVKSFGRSERRRLQSFRHRFTAGEDIAELLGLLKWIFGCFGSIEQFFLQGYNSGDDSVIPALAKFSDSLCARYADEHDGKVAAGLKYLLSSPSGGSACKRLNLFLRWMVRCDEVDIGLWKSVDPAKLVVPVDVHIARLCQILGLYERRTASVSAALEITGSFARIEPSDPVKYDFALSRIGIWADCDGRYGLRCETCELLDYCLKRKDWGK